MRGKWLLISGSVTLLAVAIGALTLLRRGVSRSPATTQTSTQTFAGSEVSLPGKIQAQQVVLVGASVEGTVAAFLVDVGQEVYEGQLLAQIRNAGLASSLEEAVADQSKAQSRVNSLEGAIIAAVLEASRARADAGRSRAGLDRSEKVFLRQQMLYREGAAPRLTFEKSQQEFESAKAEFSTVEEVARLSEERVTALRKDLENARRLLEQKNQDLEEAKGDQAATEVYAPADGIIVARRGQEGQEVTPEIKDLFQIAVNPSLLEVVLEPAPPVLQRIRPGQAALIQIAEVPGEGVPGTVKAVKGNQAIVEFTSPSPAVKPGLTAQVRIRLG